MAIASSLALGLGIAGAAAAAAGGIASAVGQENKRATQDDMLQDYLKGRGNFARSAMENQGASQMASAQQGFQAALGNEVAAGSSAQLDFANMLKQYAEGGNLPTQQDITRTQSLAGSLFDPQRVAMQQQFQEQLTSANRQAALSGRGINDPVLRAKLATEQSRQNALLQAQQGAYATQLAMAQPGERLGYMGQRADTLVNRGQTALANQQASFNMGSQANQQGFGQRQQQFQTAFNAFSGMKSTGEIVGGAFDAVGGSLLAAGSMGMQSGMLGGGGGAGTPSLLGRQGGSNFNLGSNLNFGGGPSYSSIFGGGVPSTPVSTLQFGAPTRQQGGMSFNLNGQSFGGR